MGRFFVAKIKNIAILGAIKILKIYTYVIMRKDFYFFRHGQTDLNVRGVWQGSGCDVLLNKTGVEQAEKLAAKVNKLKLTNLFCSPLLRAVQTANILAKKAFIYSPIVIYQDLQECYFGDVEGQSFEETRIKYGNKFIDSFLFPSKDSWNLRFPNGESKHEVFDRVMKALAQIVKESSEMRGAQNRFGIVCHAGVISALQCGLNLKDVSFENCSILHLACGGEMVAPEVKDLKQVFDV